jgi:ABC-type sugar transport system substrate-binding protein
VFHVNLAGQRIGDFELQERIGRGGMAVVYRAQHVQTGRVVALKLVDLEVASEQRDEFERRFAQEVGIIAGLEHLHIVPIYGFGMTANRYAWMAMRLVSGGTLADRLAHGPLSPDDAVRLFLPVARALGHAHARGVIHRDIKPGNVLLDEAGNPFLSDFGLATFSQFGTKITRTDTLVGTPTYVSPELVQGQAATPRSDVYSLGVLPYHLLAGRPPFEIAAGNVMSVLASHVNQPPPSLASLNPAVSPALEAVVLRALAKHPAERYDTADTLADALAAPTGNDEAHPTRLRQRIPAWAVLVSALAFLLVAAALAIFLFTRPPHIQMGEIGTADTLSLSAFDVLRARVRLSRSDGYIALLPCTLETSSHRERAETITALAERDGLPLRLLDAGMDAEAQIALVEQAIADGAQAFIICPLNLDRLRPLLDAIVADGRALAFSASTNYPGGTKLDAQNYEIGYSLGLSISLYVNRTQGGRGSVLPAAPLMLSGEMERLRGAQQALAEYAPGVSWLDVLDLSTMDATAAELEARLADDGDIPSVILTVGDQVTYRLVEGLEAAGIAQDATAIFSINAEERVTGYIREGRYVYGSMALDHREGAELIYCTIVHQLAGTSTPEFVQFGPALLVTMSTLGGQPAG